MGWRVGNGKLGHWGNLEVEDRCKAGNMRRYCCSPSAWDNGEEDFGAAAYGQGGFWAYYGEPLDQLMCELAAAHGFDPHDVWDHEFMNYKPHKHWFAAHLHDVIAVMREERDELARTAPEAAQRQEPGRG